MRVSEQGISGASPKVQQADVSKADQHVFLIGRPPLMEFVTFVSTKSVDGQTTDPRVLANEWRAANDHIHELEKQEAGYANNQIIAPPASHLELLYKEVLADPMFQRSFNIVPAEIGEVELDRLVVFQKHINLNYVRQLQEKLGATPSDEDIFRFCLPIDHPHPPVSFMRTDFNAYVFVSPSNDFRFLEPTLLESGQIAGYSSPGPISQIVGLVIGYGSNFLNTISIDGRLILNNGSHRAFALRDMGFKYAPCIIQRVSRPEELVITSIEVQQNPDLYLKAPRPPLLKDYFDSKLRKLVWVTRQLRQLKVTFGVEPMDVPST